MAERDFESALAPTLAAYVDARRAQGCKFTSSRETLLLLDSYAREVGWGEDALGKELVEGFVSQRPGEAPRTREIRASAARCLGSWLVTMGREAYVLPAKFVPSSGKYATKPRLLTEDEVGRLFSAADGMARRAGSPMRHVVIPTMLRTTYSCGLRISEACNLNVGDVDLEAGTVAVLGTKFNKSRIIPVSPPLLARLASYSGLMGMDARQGKCPFFPSPKGRYTRSAVGQIFKTLLYEAGIPHYDDGPTLHSLRHSFAVHRLARWIDEGEDVAALLPYLSAYMGHESLAGTERYLRMTVEMHPSLRSVVESIGASVIPEVI